jgi:hypothetical protein
MNKQSFRGRELFLKLARPKTRGTGRYGHGRGGGMGGGHGSHLGGYNQYHGAGIMGIFLYFSANNFLQNLFLKKKLIIRINYLITKFNFSQSITCPNANVASRNAIYARNGAGCTNCRCYALWGPTGTKSWNGRIWHWCRSSFATATIRWSAVHCWRPILSSTRRWGIYSIAGLEL